MPLNASNATPDTTIMVTPITLNARLRPKVVDAAP